MDIITIYGGLGNQMSQYAFYLAKRRKTRKVIVFCDPNCRFEHNGYELDKIFGITLKNRIISSLLGFLSRCSTMKRRKKIANIFGIRSIICSPQCDYNEDMLLPGPQGINFYIGGWTSEKYFNSISKEIKQIYKFPISSEDPDFLYWVNLLSHTKNSVSVHIRRGDYINSCFDGVCTKEYYLNSMSHLQNQFHDSSFFFFSNDINWCKDNFSHERYFFIDCNKKGNSWRDMYLIGLCHHHIIANSTFSWWGAWLGQHPDGITIRPKWFLRNIEAKDFYPEEWVEL